MVFGCLSSIFFFFFVRQDAMSKTHMIYPIANFKFGEKTATAEKDTSVSDRMRRMRDK